MKIMFLYVNPYNSTGILIGISYLISILKEKGHEVDLFETTFSDFNYSDFNISGKMDENGRSIIRDFKEKVEAVNPDLIGVSCTSLCLNFAIEMIGSLEGRPKTIFGGVGATIGSEDLIKNDCVDFLCSGFGEECLPKLMANLENKKEFNDVPNLIYMKNGKVIKNNFLQNIDLSNLPIPDWSLFDERHFERIFKGEVKRWGNFQLSRGCPFNCAYCVNNYYHKELGMGVYMVPVEKVITEMKLLSKKYRLDIIRIFDECFGFGDLTDMREFARLYKNEVRLPTIIETRPEAINEDTIQILKDINCISVSIGVETGNEKQREEMLNRHVSNERIKKAFRLLNNAGIRTSSYNIIGFPGDTRGKIFETIKLNRFCKPNFINVFLFCPFPKTQLRAYCLEHNFLDTKEIVDYGKKSVIKNDALSKEELYGLFRTFKYYVKLSEDFYPLIKRAEKDDEVGKELLKLLEQVLVNKGDF